MILVKRRGKLVILSLIVAVLISALVSSVGNVTRAISLSGVNPGALGEVNLILDIDENNPYESYYYIEEYFPTGWIVNAPGNLSVVGNKIILAGQTNFLDKVFTYNYFVPISVIPGTYQFSGQYALGSPILSNILGNTSLLVVSLTGCGDGLCNAGETCASCAIDCGACPVNNPGGNNPGGGGNDGGGGDAPIVRKCNDDLDNDFDGLKDYPADPGCTSVNDDDETNYVQPVGSGECEESWICSPFSECNEQNMRIKTCYDENQCGTELYKPVTEESCGGGLVPDALGIRLDLIFAGSVGAISLVFVVVGLVIWARERYGAGGILEKRKALIEGVK